MCTCIDVYVEKEGEGEETRRMCITGLVCNFILLFFYCVH